MLCVSAYLFASHCVAVAVAVCVRSKGEKSIVSERMRESEKW